MWDALVDVAQQSVRRRNFGDPAAAGARSGDDAPAVLDTCASAIESAAPTSTVRFSVLLDFHQAVDEEPPGDQQGAKTVNIARLVVSNSGAPITASLACVDIRSSELDPTLVYEVLIDQTWQLRRLLKGDVAHVQSLGPNEEVALSSRQKIVSSLQRTTTTTREDTSSVESTTTANEVYNVTRNSTRSRNWSVNANAVIPIKTARVTAGGGVGAQATDAINSSLKEIEGSTTKSSEQLRVSTKTEVVSRQVDESEAVTRRLIRNPYFDRALDVVAYEVAKEYDVRLKVSGAGMAIRLDMLQLRLDRAFVRRYSAFLTDELLDDALALGLADALDVAGASASDESVSERLAAASRRSLAYLFEVPNIFNVNPINGVDANVPNTSFDASTTQTGLHDARQHDVAVQFTVLNVFWKIYDDIGPDLTDDEAIELALSLHDSIGRRWLTLMDDPGGIGLKELLDENNFTEPLRRLGGFAAYVEGIVRPLLKPSEEERADVERRREASAFIDRVVEHLSCNRFHYVERFLVYLAQTTRGRAIADFVRQLEILDQLEAVAPVAERSYVDGHHIVLPLGEEVDRESLLASLTQMGADVGEVIESVHSTVTLPGSGLHLEAVASDCVLSDLPAWLDSASTTRVEAHVDVDKPA